MFGVVVALARACVAPQCTSSLSSPAPCSARNGVAPPRRTTPPTSNVTCRFQSKFLPAIRLPSDRTGLASPAQCSIFQLCRGPPTQPRLAPSGNSSGSYASHTQTCRLDPCRRFCRDEADADATRRDFAIQRDALRSLQGIVWHFEGARGQRLPVSAVKSEFAASYIEIAGSERQKLLPPFRTFARSSLTAALADAATLLDVPFRPNSQMPHDVNSRRFWGERADQGAGLRAAQGGSVGARRERGWAGVDRSVEATGPANANECPGHPSPTFLSRSVPLRPAAQQRRHLFRRSVTTHLIPTLPYPSPLLAFNILLGLFCRPSQPLQLRHA